MTINAFSYNFTHSIFSRWGIANGSDFTATSVGVSQLRAKVNAINALCHPLRLLRLTP